MSETSWLSSVGPNVNSGISFGATAYPAAYKPMDNYSFGSTTPSLSSVSSAGPGVEPVLVPVGTGDTPQGAAGATSGGIVAAAPSTAPTATGGMGAGATGALAGTGVTGALAGTGVTGAMGAGVGGGIPTKNSMAGGGSVGGQLADSFKAIGDMISNYNMAGAYGKQEVAAQAPQTMMTPALASFSVPVIQRR